MGGGHGGLRRAPARELQPTATRSPSWLRPFLLVNGFLVALAAAVDRLEAAMGPSFLACLAACALRDAAVVLFLDVATAGKARLNDRARPSRSQVKDAWRRLFLVAAPVDAITLCLARHPASAISR